MPKSGMASVIICWLKVLGGTTWGNDGCHALFIAKNPGSMRWSCISLFWVNHKTVILLLRVLKQDHNWIYNNTQKLTSREPPIIYQQSTSNGIRFHGAWFCRCLEMSAWRRQVSRRYESCPFLLLTILNLRRNFYAKERAWICTWRMWMFTFYPLSSLLIKYFLVDI